MSTYSDKLAELRATAEGGTAGRNAYKEGRQRLISDQRAAIDAALAGPVRFGQGTAEALEGIVAPVGSAGAARMDFAGERHEASLGALDSALERALGQQAGARDLNYSTTLGDMRTATDRNISLAEISRRKAEEAAAARASAAGGGANPYSQSEQKAAAEALGGMVHDEALAAQQAEAEKKLSDELVALGRKAFAGMNPHQLSGLTRRLLMERDNPEAIAALISEHSPAYADEAGGVLSRGFDAIRSIGSAVANQSRGGDLDELLSGYTRAYNNARVAPRQAAVATPPVVLENQVGSYDALLNDLAQQQRQHETERYLYNQDAYTQLFGDPLLAAGVFPQSFDPVEEAIDTTQMANQYISSGMYGKDYEQAIESDEETVRFDIATGAGVSYNIVDRVVENLATDGQALYEILATDEGAAVVSGALDKAAEEYGNGLSHSDVKRTITTTVAEKAEEVGLGDYGKELAAIVREQYEALYGG